MYRKTYAVFSLDVELDIILQCRRLQLAGSAFGNEVLRGCLVLCTKGFVPESPSSSSLARSSDTRKTSRIRLA